MIRLSRNRAERGLARDFKGRELIEKHEDLIARYFAGRSNASPIKWSSAKWKSARTRLKNESFGKCAYCEAPTSVVAHGDVEHFRPKSIYWWLAYNFDNYLYSCQICNQVYKRDQFPVSGTTLLPPLMPDALPAGTALSDLARSIARAVTTNQDQLLEAEWGIEDAELPHPYLEDPAKYFVYVVDDLNKEIWIRAAGVGRAERVLKASDLYLGINREDLRRLRFDHYEMLSVLKLSLSEPSISSSTKAAIVRQLKKMSGPTFPYSGLCRYFLQQWNIDDVD